MLKFVFSCSHLYPHDKANNLFPHKCKNAQGSATTLRHTWHSIPVIQAGASVVPANFHTVKLQQLSDWPVVLEGCRTDQNHETKNTWEQDPGHLAIKDEFYKDHNTVKLQPGEGSICMNSRWWTTCSKLKVITLSITLSAPNTAL